MAHSDRYKKSPKIAERATKEKEASGKPEKGGNDPPSKGSESKKEPAKGTDPKPDVQAGTDGEPVHEDVSERHSRERKEMVGRHEEERTTMQKRHEKEHRKMSRRHAKEMGDGEMGEEEDEGEEE